MRLYYWNAYGNNFGDAMGPDIVGRILNKKVAKLDGRKLLTERKFEHNLFALGSIFHRVSDGDVVWGTGVNPKYPIKKNLENLDIRAVRGPLTQEFIKQKIGIDCPNAFGDPGLLLPMLFPEFKPTPRRKYGIVPHFRDLAYLEANHENIISPKQAWRTVVKSILECELVISSSLHGLITAETFGIPARWLYNPELPSSKTEGTFKYNDYFASTNRDIDDSAESVEEALRIGGKKPIKQNNFQSLLNTFPFELFEKKRYRKSLVVARCEDLHTSAIQFRHRIKQTFIENHS
jgi:pyruvyltransferase